MIAKETFYCMEQRDLLGTKRPTWNRETYLEQRDLLATRIAKEMCIAKETCA